MSESEFTLRYLPLFERDLADTIDYITYHLSSPQAAQRLLDDTETAILKRLDNPLGLPPYESTRNRRHPYYVIRIRNFIVFYVVIGNCMEVRRFIYGRRDIPNLL
jgi:plasmid stabilization system protein ParE